MDDFLVLWDRKSGQWMRGEICGTSLARVAKMDSEERLAVSRALAKSENPELAIAALDERPDPAHEKALRRYGAGVCHGEPTDA